jgi:hypothetical protein
MRQATDRNVRSFVTRGLLAAVAVLGLLLAAAPPAVAGQGNAGNPGVLPPQSHPHGATYGEWAGAWWQWATSIHWADNPVADPNGAKCGVGQEGSVWFLAGTFSGTAERWCSVPVGKAIFLPVINAVWWVPEDLKKCTNVAVYLGIDPATLTQEELLRLGINWYMDHAYDLAVIIDGVPVNNLGSYRADSPAVVLPDELLVDLGLAPGDRYPAIADGFWLMLTPPSPGEHTILIHARLSTGPPLNRTAAQDIMYHLTVHN